MHTTFDTVPNESYIRPQTITLNNELYVNTVETTLLISAET
jgi:hypothetical protein